jgi:hypothetical protein
MRDGWPRWAKAGCGFFMDPFSLKPLSPARLGR